MKPSLAFSWCRSCGEPARVTRLCLLPLLLLQGFLELVQVLLLGVAALLIEDRLGSGQPVGDTGGARQLLVAGRAFRLGDFDVGGGGDPSHAGPAPQQTV